MIETEYGYFLERLELQKTIRIHGDNIVECERVLAFLEHANELKRKRIKLISASVTEIEANLVDFSGHSHELIFQFFPGFNKANRKRWSVDILDTFRNAGGILEETPDAIITALSEDGKTETILCALEFCSALQAGNQAWQRNGRAFSTVRSGCPYLYIVDFVKYELDGGRKRLNLRMPNPLVPYSYVTANELSPGFCAEVFVRSEEFNPSDPALATFSESNFAESELSQYLASLIIGKQTEELESALCSKNLDMVRFFAGRSKTFPIEAWNQILNGHSDLVSVAKKQRLKWRKTIAEKSHSSITKQVRDLSSKHAISLGTTDFPLGLIPRENVASFKKELLDLLITEGIDKNGAEAIESIDKDRDLIVCLIKGFKPAGDDNRPDRGLLPLAAMLLGDDAQIFTYIYGPMKTARFSALKRNPEDVAAVNGFWNALLSLSDTIVVDSPAIGHPKTHLVGAFRSSALRNRLLNATPQRILDSNAVPVAPLSLHEDDVDTVIHTVFMGLPEELRFEGLCNPPGGDWSGLSLRIDDEEIRWLSLPRVSGNVGGKRPDHVIQLFPPKLSAITLSIESKDRANDLESKVGDHLKQYLDYLATFAPSVRRGSSKQWAINSDVSSVIKGNIISAGAFVGRDTDDSQTLFEKTRCDFLLSLRYAPKLSAWQITVTDCLSDPDVTGPIIRLFDEAEEIEGIDRVRFRSLNEIGEDPDQKLV